jgi:hypothetical protein
MRQARKKNQRLDTLASRIPNAIGSIKREQCSTDTTLSVATTNVSTAQAKGLATELTMELDRTP